MTKIKSSVGASRARNLRNDVQTVQALINKFLAAKASVYRSLKVDGRSGPATVDAIVYVQRNFAKLSRPDGVVDPNGLTHRIMIKSVGATASPSPSSQNAGLVRLRKRARPVLSGYTYNVLKVAMSLAEVDRIDVSSTLRLVEDQARIMFNDNESARRARKTVRQYRGYGYGRAGRAADKAYSDNAGKPAAEVKKAMADEIRAWLGKGVRTSKHCVEASQYNQNNILDIPYSGVQPSKQRDEFESVLIGMANSFNKRRYSAGIKDLENYSKLNFIDKVIVERRCWHIEVPQTAKALPEI